MNGSKTNYLDLNNRNAARLKAAKAEQERSEIKPHEQNDDEVREQAIERIIEAKVSHALRVLRI